MSRDEEMARSEMSTAESVFRGAAEAPRGAGARATGGGRGATRATLADQIARLAKVSGPDAQEEVRVRAIRKAHRWAALKEQTAGILALARMVEELEALDLVGAATLLSFVQHQPRVMNYYSISVREPGHPRSSGWDLGRFWPRRPGMGG